MARRRNGGASLAEIERLYRRDLERFLRLAAAMVGDRDVARDAVHDGFAAAVRSRTSFAGRGPVEAWIWQVVINRVRNYRRDNAAPAAAAPQSHAEAALENGRGAGSLSAAIAALPERQRLIVFLHYYADLDYKSIAAVLGIRTGTVGATLHAARAALRQVMKEPTYD